MDDDGLDKEGNVRGWDERKLVYKSSQTFHYLIIIIIPSGFLGTYKL